MKIYSPMFFLFVFFITPVKSQNQPPEVKNISVAIDTGRNNVVIIYDLFDSEQDPMNVNLKVSDDCGETFLFPIESLSGDVGEAVMPGTQKRLLWHYDPSNQSNLSCFKVKIIADDSQDVDIHQIVAQVDSVRMRADLQKIEGVRHFSAGRNKLEETKDFIEQQFVEHGLQASRHNFDYQGYQATNVTGKLAGHNQEEKTYIIDGHFDTVANTPGADDNGSGTIGMIEAMRVLAQYNFDKTIKFVGFDVEEVGIVGSRHYIAEAIPSYEQIEGVFNFEMIGYLCNEPVCQNWLATGDYIVIMYNTTSVPLFQSFLTYRNKYVPQLGTVNLAVTGNGENDANARRSDHVRFWDAGIQALFMTDGANFRNPHYHRTSDRIGTLNFDFFTKVVKATIATVAELAGIRHSGVGVSDTFELLTSVAGPEDGPPNNFQLEQNYPNPFNPTTNIRYTLQSPAKVILKIYNVDGQEIRKLVDEVQSAGIKTITWDGQDREGQLVSSGVYFYKIEAGSFSRVKKMVFVQ